MAITLLPAADPTQADTLNTTVSNDTNGAQNAAGGVGYQFPAQAVADTPEQKALNQWYSDSQAKLDAAVLDPEKALKGMDLGMGDPARQKMLFLNDRAIELMTGNTDFPLEEGNLQRRLLMQHLAIGYFDGRGADSEEAFHAELKKAAQGRIDTGKLAGWLDTQAQHSAVLDAVHEDNTANWPSTLAELQKQPGFDPEKVPDYMDAFYDVKNHVSGAMSNFAQPLADVWHAMKIGSEDPAALAKQDYDKLTPEERPQFMEALGGLAKSMPEEQRATFLSNLGTAAKNAIGDTARNTLEGAITTLGGGGVVTLGDFINAPGAAENKAAVQKQVKEQQFLHQKAFADQVRNISRNDFAPTQYLSKDGSWARTFESSAYATPGLLALTGEAMIPVVGEGLMYSAMAGQSYDTMNSNLTAAGMDPEKAMKFSAESAPFVAIPQAMIMHYVSSQWLGQFPVLNQTLTNLSNQIENRALRFGMKTVVGAATGTLAMDTMNLVPSAVQAVGHALDQDIPGVKWTGAGGALSGAFSGSMETFLTLLPLSIFGAAGGMSAEKRAQAFAEATPLQRAAFGISEAHSAAIDAAAAKGPASLYDAVETALAVRDPNSPEAVAATDTLKQQIETQARAQRELDALGVNSPKFTMNQDGTVDIHDSVTGEHWGTAPSEIAAMTMARKHTTALDDLHSDQIAALSTLMQGAKAANALDPESRTVLDVGKILTTADLRDLSPEAAERAAHQQVLEEQAQGGDGGVTRSVLGSSQTEVRDGIRQTTNTIYSGGSIVDAFHEVAHGLSEKARADGTLTREDDIAMLRALDTCYAGKQTKDGKSLRFIPEGMADADIPETLLDEAKSKIFEMEILRTNKGDGKGKLGVTRGIISKNLGALARLAPNATRSFKAFIDAFRTRWGLSMARAFHLEQAARDGKFDKASYDTYVDKLLDIDQQKAHDERFRQELQRVWDMPREDNTEIPMDHPTPTEGETKFSLGPADVAGIMSGDAMERIKDPLRRAQAMRRIARNFADLKTSTDRALTLAKSKEGKGELKKQAMLQQGMLEEQYVGEAYAKHQGILSDEDLTKIKSQPGHQLLADPESPLRGRLMSKRAAIKDQPELFTGRGEYDGADGLSRSLFGGTRRPDQAAQELYDAGLIKENTPDAMWALLHKEQKTVGKMKEYQLKAQEDVRAAKQRAKTEATAWLAERVGDQEANFSPKEQILRSLAQMDAIMTALPPEMRGKLGGYTQMARIGTDESRLQYLQDKLAAADKGLNSWLREGFGKEFEDLLKRSRPERDDAGKIPKGKIGADMHELFRSIEESMGLNAEGVAAKIDALERSLDNEDLTPEQQAHIQLEMGMTALAGNWSAASATRREQALGEAQRLYDGGYMQRLVELSQQRMARLKKIDELVTASGDKSDNSDRLTAAEVEKNVGGMKGFKAKAKAFTLNLLSFPQVLGYTFGHENADAVRIGDAERDAAHQKLDRIYHHSEELHDFLKGLVEGDEFKAQQLQHRMTQERQPANGEPLGIKVELTKGKPVYWSELKCVDALLTWRQEAGQRHMEGKLDEEGNPVGRWHYTQEMMDGIAAKLSPEAKGVMDYLSEKMGHEYDDLNPIFRQIYGIDMPRNEKYWMLGLMSDKAPDLNMADPMTGAVSSGIGSSPGWLKTRGPNAVAEPKFQNAIDKFLAHKREAEHWIAYAPLLHELMPLINTGSTRDAILANHGPEAVQTLNKWLNYFQKGGNVDAAASLAATKTMNGMTNRLATSALAARLSTLTIQMTQLLAAHASVPFGDYCMGLGKLLTGNLDWTGAAKTDYMQRRFRERPELYRMVEEGLSGKEPSRFRELGHKASQLINTSDAIFTAGSYAIIHDYQTKQLIATGLSPEEASAEAHKIAERKIEELSIPNRPGAKSIYENLSSSPYMRVMWAFSSQPRVKVATAAYMMMSDAPLSQKIKTAVTVAMMTTVASSLIHAGLRTASAGGDEKKLKNIWDPGKLALGLMDEPLKAIPFFGDMMAMAMHSAAGDHPPEGNMLENVPKGMDAFRNAWDTAFEGKKFDWDDAVKDADTILSGASAFSETATEGAMVSHIIKQIYGWSKTAAHVAGK